MENKNLIIILTIIIVLLILGIGYFALNMFQDTDSTANNTTEQVNASVINNETQSSSSSESGQYGYCAICGKPLTESEANDEYTQGKVCFSCASNPDYQYGEGADYANQKLEEAYPEDYNGYW